MTISESFNALSAWLNGIVDDIGNWPLVNVLVIGFFVWFAFWVLTRVLEGKL